MGAIKGSLQQELCTNARTGSSYGMNVSSGQTVAEGARLAQAGPVGREVIPSGEPQPRTEGPGLTITLTDSMLRPAAGQKPNDGLIHDTDLQRLVRELQGAGAKSIYIGDQLVEQYTKIRAWGNNITVNSFGLGRPFVVRAFGTPGTLQAAVEAQGGVLDQLRVLDPAMVIVESRTREGAGASGGSAEGGVHS